MIRVEIQGRERWRGIYQASSTAGIDVADSSGTRRAPLGEVTRLWERRRAVGAGAIVGSLLGAGGGAFLGLIVTAVCEYECNSTSQNVFAGSLLGAAFGAGTGAIIGAAIPRWSTRYRRAGAPVPGRGAPYTNPDAPATPRRRIGEVNVLALAGAGGFPEDPAIAQPASTGFMGGLELGLAFRAGRLALGPEGSLLRGTHHLLTIGGMIRYELGDPVTSRIVPHVTAALGAHGWTTGTEQTLLTLTLGGGITLPEGWRLEARWHPSVQNMDTQMPSLVTVAAGRRFSW